MLIGIPKETVAGETRVAATPETVKKFAALGLNIVVQSGAGLASSATDAAYEAAGAKIASDAAATLADADIVLKVVAPTADETALIKQGATVLAAFAPHQNEFLEAYAAKGLTCVSMELLRVPTFCHHKLTWPVIKQCCWLLTNMPVCSP